MENVDSLVELRDEEDPVFNSRVNPEFIHARPDTGHRLPVFGFEAQLDQMEVVAAYPPGVWGKASQIR